MVLLSVSDVAYARFATRDRRIAIGTLCSISAFLVPFWMEFHEIRYEYFSKICRNSDFIKINKTNEYFT